MLYSLGSKTCARPYWRTNASDTFLPQTSRMHMYEHF